MVFGLTAISQRIAPWQVVGSHFLAGTARARGFYSHPLTFAYAALALLPFAIEVAIEKRTSLGAWTAFAMVLVALVLSESRTVLLVAGMALVLATLFRAKGKVRLGLLAGGLVIGLGMFVVPSSLSEKVLATAKGDGFDRNSQFSDDRVAFWRVHWNLAQEKPILGHGIDLSKEYLTPYYEALGLHNFPKIYPAHNTFLQVLVNGGIVALVIFLAWFGWVIWFCWKRRRTHWGYSAIAQAYGYIAVASLTQNSFQDSEVRYLLTTAILLLVIGDGQQRRESLAAVKSIPA
jgi:O-antigen ligase